MPGIRKANKRDKARHKARYGHRVTNRSIFTIKQEIDKRTAKAERAERARK